MTKRAIFNAGVLGLMVNLRSEWRDKYFVCLQSNLRRCWDQRLSPENRSTTVRLIQRTAGR
jgi:hypothetical protein